MSTAKWLDRFYTEVVVTYSINLWTSSYPHEHHKLGIYLYCETPSITTGLMVVWVLLQSSLPITLGLM